MQIKVFRDTAADRELIGCIDADNANASFHYDGAFLDAAREGQLGISERMPLRAEPYACAEIAPFFQGLLPEGEVIERIALACQVPRSAWATLIGKLGCESIGTLTFLENGSDMTDFKSRYVPLSPATADELISSPAAAAAAVAQETRLSLAGAQSKVAWTLPEDRSVETANASDWLVPMGTAPSSHIVKVSRRGEEDLAANELVCSLMATSCGIETAQANAIPWMPGAIAVKRYDRVWVDSADGRRLLRLHQEDFCQALGLPPYFKYQPEGVEANYLGYTADLLDATVGAPAESKLELAKRMAFNYAVGNCDAHLKNFSLLYNSAWTGRRLAPMYDVTCIPLTGYSTRMPFDIGEHRLIGEINESDIMSIALDLDVPLAGFDETVAEVIDGIEAFDVVETTKGIAGMAEQILDNARPRLRVLRSFLGK